MALRFNFVKSVTLNARGKRGIKVYTVDTDLDTMTVTLSWSAFPGARPGRKVYAFDNEQELKAFAVRKVEEKTERHNSEYYRVSETRR